MSEDNMAWLLRGISAVQRKFLIEHIDRVRPIGTIREDGKSEGPTIRALIDKHLISFVQAGRGTVLTDRGREVVCAALAEAAEMLVMVKVIKAAPKFKFYGQRTEPRLEEIAAMETQERVIFGGQLHGTI